MELRSNCYDIFWASLSYAEKNHALYLREKELLDLFLAHGAITRAQHDKSLHDLTEKMGEHAAAQPQG